MIHRDDLDRVLVDWIAEQDRSRAAYLDEVLAVTERTRQRPAWSFPGRWLPMQLAMQRVVMPRGVRYVVLIALLLLAFAVAAVAFVGSRPRLAPPFGLASNGTVAYTTTNGDIATVDPETGEVTVVVPGSERDSSPVYSRDGTRLAFVREVEGGQVLFAAPDRGGTSLQLTSDPVPAVEGIAWSPDGAQIAFVANSQIWIAATDGTRIVTGLPLGAAIEGEAPVWRPPTGREILFRGRTDAGFALFLVGADGSDPRPVSRAIDETNAWTFPAFTPGGDRIVTQTDGGVVVLAVEPGSGRVVGETLVDAAGGQSTTFAPRLSPDGSRFSLILAADDRSLPRIAVGSLDDPTRLVATGPDLPNLQFDHAWSPDGSVVLFWRTSADDVQLLDPAGGSARELSWSVRDATWQRIAP